MPDDKKEQKFIELITLEETEKINTLADSGYELNAPIANNMQYQDLRAIHICAILGLKKSLECLLSRGVLINQKDVNGKNALMFAIIFSHSKSLEFITLLLEKEIDINATDFDNKSSLFFINRSREPFDLLTLLVNKGADIRSNPETGRTFIDYAFSLLSRSLRNENKMKVKDCEAICNYILEKLTPPEQIHYINKIKSGRLKTSNKIKENLTIRYEKYLLESETDKKEDNEEAFSLPPIRKQISKI